MAILGEMMMCNIDELHEASNFGLPYPWTNPDFSNQALG
jgi:hypothetical protein